MKWLFRWIRNGINTIDKHDREVEIGHTDVKPYPFGAIKIPKSLITAGNKVLSNESNHISFTQNPMTFKIYPATGGHIVEYTFYNENNDRHDQALHLIPSGLDLGQELAKIMTLEALKR